ncbi:MAG: lytic transglycosylase domain-containing protein [Opitutales bacterium]|nr:lytic transglycosylase domain-containing protein [Opitutales bacterium]MCH8540828.1 lytic transglycosylase domain-containing protein [Opitutales bacterium]
MAAPCLSDRRWQALALIFFLLLVVQSWQWVVRPPAVVPENLVWREAERLGKRYDIDPGFIYAIAFAESSFDAHARNQTARGMMQLTPPAWEEVSEQPFWRAWNWRVNLRVGVEYLDFCRQLLVEADSFSYPLLAASYRFGPYAVRRAEYRMANLPETRNRIYQSLFAGELRPLPRPGD